jgi:uncharacterized protein
MSLLKTILIIAGTISLFLGIIGILIPGLPTTPFLLLSAGLYLRGSETLYKRITSNPVIGSYIREFHTRGGMTFRLKISSISIMWAMILASSIFFIQNTTWRIILLIAGLIGTIVMGFIVPTVKSP